MGDRLGSVLTSVAYKESRLREGKHPAFHAQQPNKMSMAAYMATRTAYRFKTCKAITKQPLASGPNPLKIKAFQLFPLP